MSGMLIICRGLSRPNQSIVFYAATVGAAVKRVKQAASLGCNDVDLAPAPEIDEWEQ